MLAFSIFFAVVASVLLTVAIVSKAKAGRLGGGFVPQYLPVKGMPLLDAAVLTSTERRAFAATLIDLAVRRKIRILAPEQPKAPLSVELLTTDGLTGDEAAVLDAVFGRADPSHRVRRLTKDNRTLGRNAHGILDRAQRRLIAAGLGGRSSRLGKGVIVTLSVLVIVLASFLSLGALVEDEPAAFLVVLAAIGISIAAAVVMPRSVRRFTPAAAPFRDHLAGLHDYITLAEADRLRVLQSPSGALRVPVERPALQPGTPAYALVLNERLLPYAVLFGHGKEWMEQLRFELGRIDRSQFDGLTEAMQTMELIMQLAFLFDGEVLGNIVQLAGAVGDLDLSGVDLGGVDLGDAGDGIGSLFDLLNF